MKTKRKIILLTRHGITSNEPDSGRDNLTSDSIIRLYEDTGGFLRESIGSEEIVPQNSFLWYSDKKRTLYTGKAILAGAFKRLPSPKSQEDLGEIDLECVDIQEDPRLSYEGTKYNEKALYSDMSGYFDRWFADPTANTYEGVEITPYNQVIETGRRCLVDALGNVLSGGKDLGVLATHGSIVDAINMVAINSARSTPFMDFDEIGGQFDREHFAALVLDHNQKSGAYEAKLVRDGQDYKVDLANLIN